MEVILLQDVARLGSKDDVVTIPYNNTEVVRVWTNKSKKIAEWNIFQTYSLSDITAINY